MISIKSKMYYPAVFLIAAMTMVLGEAFAQNNALVLNGAFIKMNGGTSSTPVYIVVNQTSTSGIARNSGHIISENQYNYVRWLVGSTSGSFVIPFGYSNTDYLPFTLNKTSGGSNDIDFSTWGTDDKNMPHADISDNGTVAACNRMFVFGGDSITSAIDRWWDIYSPTGLIANLTFSYRGAENATTSNPTTTIGAQHWNGTGWDDPMTGSTDGVTSGVGTTSVTGATTFSPWILVNNTAPLPVNLLDFKANCGSDGIVLNWVTTSEHNSDYFVVEQSADGVDFNAVQIVQSTGSKTSVNYYDAVDYASRDNNFGYYRLKQVDLDNAFTYSQIIKPNCSFTDVETISLFPNPVVNKLNYSAILQRDGNIGIEILNSAGQVMIKENSLAKKGLNRASTDTSGLREGLYVVKVTYDNKVAQKRFIKKNH